MLVTIFAPEYILGKAVADLYAADRSRREMRTYAKSDGVEWGLTHAFFANMGGFVLTQNCGGRDFNANDPAGRRETEAPGVEKDVEKEAPKYEPAEGEPTASRGIKITGDDFSIRANEEAISGNENKLGQSPQNTSDEISIEPGERGNASLVVEMPTIQRQSNTTRPLARSELNSFKYPRRTSMQTSMQTTTRAPRLQLLFGTSTQNTRSPRDVSRGKGGKVAWRRFRNIDRAPKENQRPEQVQQEHVLALGNNIFESRMLKGTTGMSSLNSTIHNRFAEVVP
jgi:hypothetical protein